MKILPYKPGSKAARSIKEYFNNQVIIKKNYTPQRKKCLIVNWGNSSPQFDTRHVTWLNKPDSISKASNKVRALEILKANNLPTPEFTTDINIAKSWSDNGRKTVFQRNLVNSYGGKGIKVCRQPTELTLAPLYTKYFNKTNEFRVHIFNGRIIDYVEKKARLEKPLNYEPMIRNHENGWIFSRTNILHNEEVKRLSLEAVRILNLDFGAVDIALNNENGKIVVFEVNTAPGLEGTTLQKYGEALKEYNNNWRRTCS